MLNAKKFNDDFTFVDSNTIRRRFHFGQLLASIALLSSSWVAQAQFFIMSDGTENTCTGIFVDAGNTDAGVGNPYPDENFTYTLCPDNPGDAVSVDFLAFGLQTNPNGNNSDYLFIFDGPDADSPSMGNYTGNALQGLPVTATVNNPTGCLTFVFQDNGPGNTASPGWEANISCTTPCATPFSASSIVDPPLPNPDSLSIGVCLNEEITFGDAGSSAEPGFNLEAWVWNFDDGQIDTLYTPGNVTHSFTEPGEYIVNLAVIDNNGCVSLNLQPLQVLVSTIPLFNSFQSTPVCAGSPAFVDGNPVQSITWTALPPQVVAGETYLADGAGFSYSSELNFDFFEDGATLDDCDDLLSVTVDMEHSYMGDLDLTITCPDGTTVPLMSYPNGGGGCFLGEAVDDGSNIPGTGYEYGWSPNPDIATNINDNSNWTNQTYVDNAGNNESNNVANPGIYTPEGDLCDFVGCPLNGTWTFSIVDNLAIDNGYIFEWGLNLNPALIPGVTTFTPTIGLNADSSFWTGPGIVDQDFDANFCDIVLDTPGNYDYTFTVTNSFSCTFDTTLSIEVVEGPENSISAGADQIFCGDPVQLQGAFIGGGPSPCAGSQGTTTYCYDNNENTTWTYCPDNPGDGTSMNILFYDGQIENFFDHIQVFDGDDTSAPQLADLTGDYPETSVTATNPDGCLTVLFTSDGSVSCAASTFYEEVSWCVGCGQDACGFIWNWEPADNLTNPNSAQPTVNTFDGTPTEYIAFVEPIGLENCAITDTVMVLPGFEFTTDFLDPTFLNADGEITLNITEPASEGPWDVQLNDAFGVIEQLSFGGGLQVFDNLEAGSYSLVVSDQLGCSYTIDFELSCLGDCPGCTNEFACNFDPIATIETDLFVCEYTSCYTDCGFLNGPEALFMECSDSCIWIVPDFEPAAVTTGYDLNAIGYAPPLAPGTGTVQSAVTNSITNGIGLPFGFSFFNTDFFSLKINRKGFITFNTGLTGTFNYPNQALGSNTLPPNSIMAPYAYISNSGGEIRTATLGEFPCRRFVISWENLPQTGCGSNELVTQVVLFETSNRVEMHIGQFTSCVGITAVVGIQGGSGEGSYGPAAYDTGEFAIENEAFSYDPNGATQTELVYLIGEDIVGQGDSISLCLESSTELIIGANFPEILAPPPALGSCDAIPDEACDTSLVYNFNLNAAQTGAINFPFDGELLGFAVTNNWTTSGGSWPGDMGLQLCDPSGTCGFIEGFNIDLTGTNLGDWPFNWNTTSSGFYESCFTTPPGLLEGDGSWTLTIQNGWNSSGGGCQF